MQVKSTVKLNMARINELSQGSSESVGADSGSTAYGSCAGAGNAV